MDLSKTPNSPFTKDFLEAFPKSRRQQASPDSSSPSSGGSGPGIDQLCALLINLIKEANQSPSSSMGVVVNPNNQPSSSSASGSSSQVTADETKVKAPSFAELRARYETPDEKSIKK